MIKKVKNIFRGLDLELVIQIWCTMINSNPTLRTIKVLNPSIKKKWIRIRPQKLDPQLDGISTPTVEYLEENKVFTQGHGTYNRW